MAEFTITYAVSPNRGGVYYFDSLKGAEKWCADENGEIIPESAVSPEIRRAARGHLAKLRGPEAAR